MRRRIQILGWILLVLLLSSCGQQNNASTETTMPSSLPDATQSKTAAAYPEPQTSTPVAYPDPGLVVTLTPIAQHAAIATQTNQQVYVDPGGWYSISFPIEWQDGGQSNSFVGKDGFLETGYLSEMEFMQRPTNVCQWLANIETKSTYFIYAPTILSDKARNCMLMTLPGIEPASTQAIIYNPNADYEQKFFYIKTDPQHFETIISTFLWLQPVDLYVVPEFQRVPLRAEDNTFWEQAESPTGKFTISEYELLPEGQNQSPYRETLSKYVPAQAPDKPAIEKKFDQPFEKIGLAKLGYTLEGKPPEQHLYQGGELLIENVIHVSYIYSFTTTSDPVWAFTVDTAAEGPKFNSYLVQNREVIARDYYHLDPPYPPVLHDGKLIWVRAKTNKSVTAQIQNSNQDVLFSFATYFGASIPFKGFQGWENHWILEIGSYIIQDGDILNEQYGFEETFDWRVINGKQFYFFRKGQNIGISYNDEFYPINYHDVLHGYCCALGLNNPVQIGNQIRFYAQRDGIWYYVIIEFEKAS